MADASSLEQTRDVLRRHRDDIRRTYDAVGVGVGRAEGPGGGHAITVYLRTASALPPEERSVEGIPLRFEVTGPINPLET